MTTRRSRPIPPAPKSGVRVGIDMRLTTQDLARLSLTAFVDDVARGFWAAVDWMYG